MTDPAPNVTACPLQKATPSAWDALPYLYLLRVQLLTFLALLSFPFIALWLAPNLLLGVFDVTPLGMLFVTLSATLVFALPVILTAMYVSYQGGTSTCPKLLLGVLAGAALSFIILVAGGQFKRRGWAESKPVSAFISYLGPGYKKDGSSAHEGHYLALWSFLLCFFIYIAIGIDRSYSCRHSCFPHDSLLGIGRRGILPGPLPHPALASLPSGRPPLFSFPQH